MTAKKPAAVIPSPSGVFVKLPVSQETANTFAKAAELYDSLPPFLKDAIEDALKRAFNRGSAERTRRVIGAPRAPKPRGRASR